MPEAPAALKKQIGPFSIGGWLLIGALGVGAGLLLRRAPIFKSKPEPPLELDGSGNAINPATGQPWPAGHAAASNAPASGGGSSGGTTEAPAATNLEWSRAAIAWLIANGVDPNTADRAVRLYLEGQTLDIAEANAIRLVLTSPIGVPPEYVPPMQTGSPTVPTPPSPPTPGVPSGNTTAPAGKKMLVRADDGDIAQFVSDGRTKEWVRDSYTVKALVHSGNVAAAGTDGAGWPIPYPIPRVTLNSLAPVGPPPDYGGQASPVKTTW